MFVDTTVKHFQGITELWWWGEKALLYRKLAANNYWKTDRIRKLPIRNHHRVTDSRRLFRESPTGRGKGCWWANIQISKDYPQVKYELRRWKVLSREKSEIHHLSQVIKLCHPSWYKLPLCACTGGMVRTHRHLVSALTENFDQSSIMRKRFHKTRLWDGLQGVWSTHVHCTRAHTHTNLCAR